MYLSVKRIKKLRDLFYYVFISSGLVCGYMLFFGNLNPISFKEPPTPIPIEGVEGNSANNNRGETSVPPIHFHGNNNHKRRRQRVPVNTSNTLINNQNSVPVSSNKSVIDIPSPPEK